MEFAIGRRLREELGIGAELEFVYRFSYQASFGERGSEHELCSVYIGRCDEPVRPNSTEIEAIRFAAPAELALEISERPEEFTPWFKQEWTSLVTEHDATLQKYL